MKAVVVGGVDKPVLDVSDLVAGDVVIITDGGRTAWSNGELAVVVKSKDKSEYEVLDLLECKLYSIESLAGPAKWERLETGTELLLTVD